MLNKVKHQDGEILKCDECRAEDNVCLGCGDYKYDNTGECESCNELINALLEMHEAGGKEVS